MLCNNSAPFTFLVMEEEAFNGFIVFIHIYGVSLVLIYFIYHMIASWL